MPLFPHECEIMTLNSSEQTLTENINKYSRFGSRRRVVSEGLLSASVINKACQESPLLSLTQVLGALLTVYKRLLLWNWVLSWAFDRCINHWCVALSAAPRLLSLLLTRPPHSTLYPPDICPNPLYQVQGLSAQSNCDKAHIRAFVPKETSFTLSIKRLGRPSEAWPHASVLHKECHCT